MKDGDDRIKLRVGWEKFIVRRSALARVRRSYLWELFGGGRENDSASHQNENSKREIELGADPGQFEKVLAVLQLLEVMSDDLGSFYTTLHKFGIPCGNKTLIQQR